MNTLTIILTSVVVSSLVSGVFLFINDWLRRKSEEKQKMFEVAIRLTKMRDEQIGEILKHTEKKVLWPAPLNTFEKTFKHVQDIWKGKSKETKKTIPT